MTPEEQAQQESLKKMTEGQDKAAVVLKRLMDAMEDFEDPVKRQARLLKDSERSFASLDRAIKSGRKSWIEAIDSIEDLRETIEELEEGKEKSEKQRQLNEVTEKAKRAQYNKLLIDSAAGLAKAMTGIGVGVTKSLINSYQSGASAFQTYGDAMSAGIDQSSKTAKGFAAGLGAGALGLAALGVVSGGTAVALGAIAGVAAEVFESFNDLAKFGIQVAVKELDATAKAYNSAAQAGALFTDGIMDFRNAGPEAGLTMVQFSKLISENGEKFAQLGGTVTQGVKNFRDIGISMKGAREELIKLGYSVEDIASGALDYAAMVSSVSNKQRTDYANLAIESTKYLENLRVITAFTGEDAKRAKEAADVAARDAAVDARLRKEEAEGNANVKAKFEAMIMAVPPALRDSYKQAYGMYGAVTGENALLMAQSSTAMGDMNRNLATLSDKTKSASDVSDEQLQLQKQHSQQIANEIQQNQSQIGMAASATGQFRELGVSMQSANDYYTRIGKGESPEKIRENLKTLANAGGDTGKYAKLVADSQDLHIRMQKELDLVITQFDNFAKVTDNVITGIRKALDKAGYQVGGGGGAGGVVSMDGSSIIPSGAGAPPAPATGGKAPAPATGGAPPATTGAPATPGAQADGLQAYKPVAGLGSNGRIGGRGITAELQSKLELLGQAFPGATLTGLNDSDIFSAHSAPDKHGLGTAVDFRPRDMDPLLKDQYVDILKRMGFKFAQYEPPKLPENPNGHIHAELKDGGITNGPSLAGEAGPEAVIPLPNGRSIPVKMDVGELVDKMEELISVMKAQHATSEKILWAQS